MDTKCRWCLFTILLSVFQSAIGYDEDFVSCNWGDLNFNCKAIGQDKEHTEVFNENSFYRDKYKYCLPDDLHTYGRNRKVIFNNCNFSTVPRDLFQRLQSTRIIDLDGSGISTIGDARFPDANELADLWMSNNNLSELPTSLFSNTLQLRTVIFSYNQIQNIDPKTFSETKDLGTVNFAHNLIEAIDEKTFHSLTKLYEIDFSYNRLETFHTELLKSEHLSRLILNNNRITRLDCDIFDSLGANERKIDISMNQLREIDLSCDKSDKRLILDIRDNFLENLTLPSANLGALYASRNKIQNISIQNELKNLVFLELANNSLSDVSDIFKYCTSLDTLDLSFNDIEDISAVSPPKTLKLLNLAKNRIGKLKCNIFPDSGISFGFQTMIDASLNQLTEIDLNCDKVSENLVLIIEDNLLENLSLPSSTLVSNMLRLFASRNKIRNFSIGNELKNLTELYLANNSLSDVSDVYKHCISLQTLDLSFNNLRKLGANSLIKMTQLEILLLSQTNLSHINYGTFSYSKKLRFLDLSRNNLKHFYFDWLLPFQPYLKKLHLNDNKITRFFGSPKDVSPALNELTFFNNSLHCGHLGRFVKEISATRIQLPSKPEITSYDDARSHVAGIVCCNPNEAVEPKKGEIIEAIFENSKENAEDIIVKLTVKMKGSPLHSKDKRDN